MRIVLYADKRAARRKTANSLKKLHFLEIRSRFNASHGLRSVDGEPKSSCRKTLSLRLFLSISQLL